MRLHALGRMLLGIAAICVLLPVSGCGLRRPMFADAGPSRAMASGFRPPGLALPGVPRILSSDLVTLDDLRGSDCSS